MANLANSREAYGAALLELAAVDNRIIALDADLSKSTKGNLIEERFPERHIEMGIAEQNMVSTAAGLAIKGKIPFVHSFAVFLTGRAFDQIRVGVALARTNVKLIGSSAGLSDYGDGATHQMMEDVALMRALPNMTVIVPCDGREIYQATKAIAAYQGPVYFRIGRSDMPAIFPENEEFSIGKVYRLRQGRHVTVFANGIMVSQTLKAAEMLAGDGIEISVVNVSTVKPLDRETIIALARETGYVVVAEEHSMIGGLCGAIAEALRAEKNIAMEFVAIRDVFGQSSCSYEQLLKEYGLMPEDIAAACRKVMSY